MEQEIRELSNQLSYWRNQTRHLEIMNHNHDCRCRYFVPCDNFQKKYYAVDLEKQKLVDIITKSQVKAKDLLEDLNFKP